MRARARLISRLRGLCRLPVGSILDAGCGVGLLRAPLLRALRASYTGLEFSDYLCERYGWRQGSIETFRSRERFDLVICYDVLQYLSAAPGAARDRESGALCRGALYFGALTREDWRDNCDQTAHRPHPRPAARSWYRRELHVPSGHRLRHVAQARAAADTVEPGRRGVSTRCRMRELIALDGAVECGQRRAPSTWCCAAWPRRGAVTPPAGRSAGLTEVLFSGAHRPGRWQRCPPDCTMSACSSCSRTAGPRGPRRRRAPVSCRVRSCSWSGMRAACSCTATPPRRSSRGAAATRAAAARWGWSLLLAALRLPGAAD
jgi:SAM-dependent methyltransferase